jgi:hypothetical protein
MVKCTMIRTYKALLHGNSLEWIGEAPDYREDYPMTVEVAVLEDRNTEDFQWIGELSLLNPQGHGQLAYNFRTP